MHGFCQLDTSQSHFGRGFLNSRTVSVRMAGRQVCGAYSGLMMNVGMPIPLCARMPLGKWVPGCIRKQIEQVAERQ